MVLKSMLAFFVFLDLALMSAIGKEKPFAKKTYFVYP
jgi:hypothetical protein